MCFCGVLKFINDFGVMIVYEDVFVIVCEEGFKVLYEMCLLCKVNLVYWICLVLINCNDQIELVIDCYSGDILKWLDFQDNLVVVKIVFYGILFYQGEFYGLINLIQNMVVVILVLILLVMGFVVWWKCCFVGSFGVLNVLDVVLSSGIIVLVVVLLIFFFLVGVLLIVVLIFDWVILC